VRRAAPPIPPESESISTASPLENRHFCPLVSSSRGLLADNLYGRISVIRGVVLLMQAILFATFVQFV
jgi:hypothetical protein